MWQECVVVGSGPGSGSFLCYVITIISSRSNVRPFSGFPIPTVPIPVRTPRCGVCLQKHCWHPHAFLLVFILVSVTACLGRSVAPLSCQADSGKLYQTSHPQLNCLFFPYFFHLALSFSVSRCSIHIFRWMLIYGRVLPSNHILYKISRLELANILFG